MSLPNPTADPAVYILTGTIPIEGLIHKRALSLFGNVCRSGDGATEWQLAKRQLTVKTLNSKSWFIAIKKILIKYDLPDPVELLCNPPKKSSWKQSVNKQINSYWIDRIKCSAKLYSSLQNIAVDNYACGRCHHLLKSTKKYERSAAHTHQTPNSHWHLYITSQQSLLQPKQGGSYMYVVQKW